jgi:hypothetical protein
MGVLNVDDRSVQRWKFSQDWSVSGLSDRIQHNRVSAFGAIKRDSNLENIGGR